MKIITLTCPCCDARLITNDDNSHAVCEYCGYHFLMVDEKQKGINAENLQEMAHKLADRIQKLKEPVSELERTDSRITELRTETNHISAEIERLQLPERISKSTIGRWIPLYILGLVIIISVMIAASEKSIGYFGGGVIWGGLLAIPSFLLRIGRRHKLITLQESLTKKNDEMTKLQQRADVIKRENDFSILPQPYRNRKAIDGIYVYLSRERAFTIQQAINLYEDDLKRESMEELLERKTQELQAGQRGLRQQQMDVIDKLNGNGKLSAAETVVAAGTILAVGSKIMKHLKDF